MSQHFKFLSANLQFLSRHLLEKPEMLLIGKDVTDASHLVGNVTQVFLIRPDREKIIVLSLWFNDLRLGLSVRE